MPYGYGDYQEGANNPYQQFPQAGRYNGSSYDGVQYPGQHFQSADVQNMYLGQQHQQQPYRHQLQSSTQASQYHHPYQAFTPQGQQYPVSQQPRQPSQQVHARPYSASPSWSTQQSSAQASNIATPARQTQRPSQNFQQHQQQQQGYAQQSSQLNAGLASPQFPHLNQTYQQQYPRSAISSPPVQPQLQAHQGGASSVIGVPRTVPSASRQQQSPRQSSNLVVSQPTAQQQDSSRSPPQHSSGYIRQSEPLRPHTQNNVSKVPRHQAPSGSPVDSSVELPATINPNVLYQPVARVEIPVPRSSVKVERSEMAPSLKRRKSNDGAAVPVCGNTAAAKNTQSTKPSQEPQYIANVSPKPRTSQAPLTPDPANIDYQSVLLGLSDEYISAAYGMSGSLTAAEVLESDMDQYHALLSTGMGCLDSVLKNYHISDPRKEAQIRLRLASLLYEETNNDVQAEEVLSKGVSVCERARLPDLKYAMHHLMARIWFKGGRVKTAIKAVEKNIVEVQKLNMLHWVYAFRFLHVSLGLRAGNTPVESSAINKQLLSISELAIQHQHVAVQYVASTFAALVHLRSRTPDSIDLAQRALAAGRTHQLSAAVDTLPQAKLLLDCVDLGCSLARFRHDQILPKVEAMHTNMDSLVHGPGWRPDGSWDVPLGVAAKSLGNIEAESAGVFRRLDNGQYGLRLRWLTSMQVFTLGFLLSGLAGIHKNASHERKSEEYFKEGFKLAKSPLEPVAQSMAAASARDVQQTLTRIIIRLYVVFASCGRADWARSLKGISNIRKDVADLEGESDEGILTLMSYLEAVSRHGLGDLHGALRLYRSPELKLDFDAEAKSPAGSPNSIKILAALNSVLIMRHHGEEATSETLLYNLKPHCLTAMNSNGNEFGSKAMESVFFILKAVEPNDASTDNPIIKTKMFLQSAVSAAKSAVNNQLLCVVMNVMTDSFFHNIVGEQAEKSARAGRALAKKSDDPLWTAVSDGMYMDTLERCGKKEEAAQAQHEAHEALLRLPASLKSALQQGTRR